MAAWDSWLGSQPAPISTPVRYKHSPPWPYSGSYPYVIILPRDQTRRRYSDVEVYNCGWWRLMYVDLVGATYTSVGDLLAAAAAWAEDVTVALQASEQSRSLAGAVDYVGEGEDGGDGLVVRWDEKSAFVDTNNTPGWGVPVDVYVRELPVLG
jgi:hypothetical protein